MQSMPLPMIVHRVSQPQQATNNSLLPDSPSAAIESMSQNAYSQSTINTMLNSYSEAAPPSGCVPLPTTGCYFSKQSKQSAELTNFYGSLFFFNSRLKLRSTVRIYTGVCFYDVGIRNFRRWS